MAGLSLDVRNKTEILAEGRRVPAETQRGALATQASFLGPGLVSEPGAVWKDAGQWGQESEGPTPLFGLIMCSSLVAFYFSAE